MFVVNSIFLFKIKPTMSSLEREIQVVTVQATNNNKEASPSLLPTTNLNSSKQRYYIPIDRVEQSLNEVS